MTTHTSDLPNEALIGPGGPLVIERRTGERVLIKGIFDAAGQPVECVIQQMQNRGKRSVWAIRAPRSVKIVRIEEGKQP